MTKKSRISILLAAMMAFSVVSAVTPVIAAEPDSIEYIYYNSVELDGDSFVFTLTETTPTVSTFGLDTVESYSKTVTSVKVTPVTEDYYNEMYADLIQNSDGSDFKTRYCVDTTMSYNMYLTVEFDIQHFQLGVNEEAEGVRIAGVNGGYYGYGGSGSEIGSGVSIVSQQVVCTQNGREVDDGLGGYVTNTKTYNPSASSYDWSYRLPSNWGYIDGATGLGAAPGAVYTTTARRGTTGSTWSTDLQVDY